MNAVLDYRFITVQEKLLDAAISQLPPGPGRMRARNAKDEMIKAMRESLRSGVGDGSP